MAGDIAGAKPLRGLAEFRRGTRARFFIGATSLMLAIRQFGYRRTRNSLRDDDGPGTGPARLPNFR